MERSVALNRLYLKFATTYSGFQRGNGRIPGRATMKLLHIDSSALGANSVTRELTAAIVARWQDQLPGLEVTYRDLDAEPLPHLTGPVLTKADAAAAEESERA